MEVYDLELPGIKLIKPRIFTDQRGFFLENYSKSQYARFGIDCTFVQDNYVFSKMGTLRGMHFQNFPGQDKLVTVAVGTIYDVVVDIRPGSPTYGKWLGVYLDGESREQLFIPKGFAHGYCVTSNEAHVLYKVSSAYDPAEERGFRYDDPEIGIQWPVHAPLISERDRDCPCFAEVVTC